MQSRSAPRSAFALAALTGALLLAVSSAPASPITDALVGEWSGSGRIELPDGKTERIRCKGTTRSRTANSVDQNFKCASTALKNTIFKSTLHFTDGRVRGEWESGTHRGILLGDATSTSLKARLTSDSGSGSLSSRIRGCTQDLTITGWTKQLKTLTARLKKC